MATFPQQTEPFVPVLCVGDAVTPELVDACRRENIGMITTVRGLKLLKHFRVKAVVCRGADPAVVLDAIASDTPVILLASEQSDWSIPGVTVISSDTPAAMLAFLIRDVATGEGRFSAA